MTGSGLAQGSTALGDLTVELRSVNGRNLGVKMRLASECQGLEAALESCLRSRFSRGSLTLWINVENPQRNVAALVDDEMARQVVQQLRQLQKDLGLEAGPRLREVLSFPGVVTSNQGPRVRTSWEPPEDLLALVGEAADRLTASRQEEGATTVAEMRQLLDTMEAELSTVSERAPEVIAEYREKLLKRVNEFLVDKARALEDSDVIREVALFADRADISEELQRLQSHLQKARSLLDGGGQLGRNLEFLLQELLREANTLGSKSPDTEIAHRVVAVKSCIDKLKEQAANLE